MQHPTTFTFTISLELILTAFVGRGAGVLQKLSFFPFLNILVKRCHSTALAQTSLPNEKAFIALNMFSLGKLKRPEYI